MKMKDLRKAMVKDGYEDRTGKGHVKLYKPGIGIIVMPATESDCRAVDNAKATVRRKLMESGMSKADLPPYVRKK